MAVTKAEKVALTMEGCRMRQQRLAEVFAGQKLDAALLTHPGHVQRFSGYWCRPILPVAMVIRADGRAVLVSGAEATEPVCADEHVLYESDRYCTLVEDLKTAAVEAALPHLGGAVAVGCDEPTRPWLLEACRVESLHETLLALRRRKDVDEVAMIRHAIAGCDAAYTAARGVLAPGVEEVEVHAAMHAAAIVAVGEAIGEFGNDFQSGTPGGPPRRRPAEAGELMPLDIGVVYRGYHSDLCRTFSVDRNPTSDQEKAHALVCDAMAYVESTAAPGVKCRDLFDHVHGMLDGQHGWRFFHHLGHGVGLAPHEAPRLNPNWDDTLAVGDVFTVEPGIYADDLRGGIRLEHDFLVTDGGVERLSQFPLDL